MAKLVRAPLAQSMWRCGGCALPSCVCGLALRLQSQLRSSACSPHLCVQNTVVAVKVMKQQLEGRHAMRTAWELAVTRSLNHVNIVAVHAVLTDVAVLSRAHRVLMFVPHTARAACLLGGAGRGLRVTSPNQSACMDIHC